MRSIIRELWRHRTRIIIGVLALFLVDGSQLVVPRIVGTAIDDLLVNRQDRLWFFALLILGLAAVVAVFRFAWRYFLIGASRRIRRDLRNRLYTHILTLPASFYNKTKTGDLMSRFTNDADAVMMACGFGILSFADFLIMVSFSLVAMLVISPSLTLYAFLPLPLLTIMALIFGRVIHRRFQVVQESFSNLTEKVREALSGVRTIKSFAQETGMSADFAAANDRFVEENMRLVRVSGLFDPMIIFMSGLSEVIVLWLGGDAVIAGEISLGDFVAFMSYLGLTTWPMMALGMVINMMQRGSASMERIEAILRTAPEIHNEPEAKSFDGPGHLVLRDCSFSYEGGITALEKINLSVRPGTTLGVVGLTGSGKSTLAHLILRVYDPTAGEATLDGAPLRSYAIKELRSRIALVSQDAFLFSTTIGGNIAFAADDASTEQIRQAARLAGIETDILEMADGFSTMVGERGITLSGGQKQRVAIARALLVDPKILILDDALSAVDAAKEEEILDNLRDILQSRISIVIAHRISAVKDLDHIIVLDNGRIVEEGDHRTLIARDGLYAHLHELQQAEEVLNAGRERKIETQKSG